MISNKYHSVVCKSSNDSGQISVALRMPRARFAAKYLSASDHGTLLALRHDKSQYIVRLMYETMKLEYVPSIISYNHVSG